MKLTPLRTAQPGKRHVPLYTLRELASDLGVDYMSLKNTVVNSFKNGRGPITVVHGAEAVGSRHESRYRRDEFMAWWNSRVST